MKKDIKVLLVIVILLGLFVITGCGRVAVSSGGSKSNTETKTVNSDLVGRWEYQDGGGFVYVFRDNGTGSYLVGANVMNFTYTTDGDKLSILYDGDTISLDTEYSINGNVLNVKDSSGNDTLYKKVG